MKDLSTCSDCRLFGSAMLVHSNSHALQTTIFNIGEPFPRFTQHWIYAIAKHLAAPNAQTMYFTIVQLVEMLARGDVIHIKPKA